MTLHIDLHTHSTRSDGLLTPARLVARAAERGVKVLALTDHDELDGLAEARAEALRLGIEFIDGVEISASWSGLTLHIVGLCIDPRNAALASGLQAIRDGRDLRAARIAAELERAGIHGSLEGARAYVTNPGLVGRTHFARFLVERGHARDTQSVFRKFLVSGKPGHVPHEWAGLAQAVDWIRGSGGWAVLAHPGRYRLDNTQREQLLDEFAALGGSALEVVTGSHRADEYDIWMRHATRHGLLASAGSDYHGAGEGRLDLGHLPELPAGGRPVWSQW